MKRSAQIVIVGVKPHLEPMVRGMLGGLLASGEVLMVERMPPEAPPPSESNLVITYDAATTGDYLPPPIEKPKEPWRRGRPLR